MEIRVAESDADVQACFAVLKQLRPQLDASTFVADVRRMAREGFTLALLADPEVRAVAGYRPMEMFATGKILYVDDLVTDPSHRSRGYGRALLQWLRYEAERLGCKYVELDSGSKRTEAHRFYRANGLEEVALHFSVPTRGTAAWTESPAKA